MKTYIYINPFNGKPYEFSNCSFTTFKLSANLRQPDGSFIIEYKDPIILEVDKFDLSLLTKQYNPETGVLE